MAAALLLLQRRGAGPRGKEGNDDRLDLASIECVVVTQRSFLSLTEASRFYTDGLETVLEELTRHAIGRVEAVHPQPLHVAHI